MLRHAANGVALLSSPARRRAWRVGSGGYGSGGYGSVPESRCMGNVRIVAFTWAESGDGERLSEADSWHSASDMKHWSLRPPCMRPGDSVSGTVQLF